MGVREAERYCCSALFLCFVAVKNRVSLKRGRLYGELEPSGCMLIVCCFGNITSTCAHCG
jgi:hypothetical protein